MKSGFNIATWITFDPEFSNMLGITSDEFDIFLDEVYSDYQIVLDKNQVKQLMKKYYDGYRFLTGEKEVYNPMMTIYFLNYIIRNNQYPPDLVDRNLRIDYNQIAFLFGQNLEKASKIITQISENKTYNITSTLDVSFDMKDYKEGKYIAEGLYYSGILTHGEYTGMLQIPNLITYDFAIKYFEEINKFEPDNDYISNWIMKFLQTGDSEVLFEGFFRDVIQAFPGDFFANVNESFYHGLFFHLLLNNTKRNSYEVLPEFNLPQGQVDLMFRSYPGAHVQKQIKVLFELKRVKKTATDEELTDKLNEGITQMQKYLTADYADWQGVVVCFRGNKDYKIKIKIKIM
jgi:hypothetical protein